MSITFRPYAFSKLVAETVDKEIIPYYKGGQSLLDRINSKKDEALIMLRDSVPVGIFAYQKEQNRLKITALTVMNRNENGGRGYHSKLLDKVMEIAKDSFIETVSISLTSNRDDSFKEFFQNKGFEVKKEESFWELSLDLQKRVEKRKLDVEGAETQVANRPKVEQRPIFQPKFTSQEGKRHTCTLKQIYLDQIQRGQKTIEGRINSGMFKAFKAGDTVKFFCNRSEIVCKITKVERFDTFKKMLEGTGYKKCLPFSESLESAAREYAVIPGYPQKEKQFGVLAIHLEKM